MTDEQKMVEAQVVRLTRLAHPTDQGTATSALETGIRMALEGMIGYGESKAQKEVEAHGFGNIKSGKKLAKKLRQTYAREIRDAAQERSDTLYKTFEEHLRPCPKWMPAGVWKVIQRVVLRHYV